MRMTILRNKTHRRGGKRCQTTVFTLKELHLDDCVTYVVQSNGKCHAITRHMSCDCVAFACVSSIPSFSRHKRRVHTLLGIWSYHHLSAFISYTIPFFLLINICIIPPNTILPSD